MKSIEWRGNQSQSRSSEKASVKKILAICEDEVAFGLGDIYAIVHGSLIQIKNQFNECGHPNFRRKGQQYNFWKSGKQKL